MKDNIGVILLGAGNSKRFGRAKQFQLVDGEEMYWKTAKKFATISEQKVFVTQFEEMRTPLESLGYEIAINPNPERGIASSIERGIETLMETSSDLRAILFAVCDQPRLSVKTIQKLVATSSQNPDKIICLSWQKQLGNPVIFPISYQGELLELQGDVGGKRIVSKHLGATILVEAESAKELFDVDREEDLEKLNRIK